MTGDPFVQRVALIGELDRAAGAVHQPGAQARLELGDRLADAGLRHAQPCGGAAEALGVGNGREDREPADELTVDIVHRRCLRVIQAMTARC